MKKWFRVVLLILSIVLISAFVLYRTYLTPQFVDEPKLSNSLQTKSIIVNGQERIFHWYAPQKSSGIHTILYVLHGSTSNGLDIRKATAYEFDKIADEEGLVIIYPTGYDNHWNDCRGSADYIANIEDVDDFAFFQTLESDLENTLNLKFQYRFATGHSNGGHMCFKLALERPEWINGIAPISANMPVKENLDCGSTGKFVPICLINGTADKVNPYEGGLVEIMGNASRGTVLSTDETMAYWTNMGNCSTPQYSNFEDHVPSDNSTIEQTIWYCDSTLQAINYKVVNGGHVIPHPKSKLPKILGKTNQDLNAPMAIWSFFKEVVKDSK